jgi:hypothetical protein
LLVGLSGFCLSALTPTFTSLRALQLGIANAYLRATVSSDAKIDLWFSERGRGDQDAGTDRSSGEQGNSFHVANPHPQSRRPTVYNVLSKAWP